MSAWLIAELKKLPQPDSKSETIVMSANGRAEFDYVHQVRANAENQALRMCRLRETHKLSSHFTLQALRRTAAKRAAPVMSPQQYSEYFGHSLTVAVKHYIGYGQFGSAGAENVLDFSIPAPKIANHTGNHTPANEKTA